MSSAEERAMIAAMMQGRVLAWSVKAHGSLKATAKSPPTLPGRLGSTHGHGRTIASPYRDSKVALPVSATPRPIQLVKSVPDHHTDLRLSLSNTTPLVLIRSTYHRTKSFYCCRKDVLWYLTADLRRLGCLISR